ncbi:MAG: WD40/YVTN/BNR-like repeat-containing protein [Acidimicrobiales bacterium]
MESGKRARRRARARGWCQIAITVVAALTAAGCLRSSPPQKPRHRNPPEVTAMGRPAPPPMQSALGVSCASTRRCLAVGLGSAQSAAIALTTDAGASWGAVTVPPSVDALNGVSCDDGGYCMAVGSSLTGSGQIGAAVFSSDGGTTWSSATSPSGSVALTGVSCAAKLRCLAIATDGSTYWSALTANGGATWSRGGGLPGQMSVNGAFTCWTPQSCLVAGFVPTSSATGNGAIAATSNAGTTWAPVTLPAGVGVLRAVDCNSANCMAVGSGSGPTSGFAPAPGQLLSSDDSGASWSVARAPLGDDGFGVACPNQKACLIVGTRWTASDPRQPTPAIVATVDDGLSWHDSISKFVPVGMDAVACPVANRCVAAGGNVLASVDLPIKVARKAKAASGSRAR